MKGLLHSCGKANHQGLVTAGSHSHPQSWKARGPREELTGEGLAGREGLPTTHGDTQPLQPKPSRGAAQGVDT